MSSKAEDMDKEEAENSEESESQSVAEFSEAQVRELERANADKDNKIKELQSKLNDYDIKFIEARGFVKKLESEVEQIRQRSERDLQKNIESRVSSLMQSLLPVVDSFDLSLKSAEASKDNSESLMTGLKMIRIQMEDCLRNVGLERIKTIGENFDPNVHEALMSQQVSEPEKDGKVVMELKAGYKLGALVVRPAQVAVGQFSE